VNWPNFWALAGAIVAGGSRGPARLGSGTMQLDLDVDDVPKFVPRKRRAVDPAGSGSAPENRERISALSSQKGGNSVSRETPRSAAADPQTAASAAPQAASAAPQAASVVPQAIAVPAWRLAKERETLSEAADLAGAARPAVRKWRDKCRSEMGERDWRIMRRDLQISAREIGKSEIPLVIEPLLGWDELSRPHVRRQLLAEFPEPTPAQRCAVKLALDGKNTVIRAPTGSGKTLAFLVPIAELRPRQALVLAPTRELALQIGDVARHLGLHTAVLVGGQELEAQSAELSTKPPVVVATPGRLLDFLGTGEVALGRCDYLVFDEADRMIDLGFEPQISAIMRHIGKPLKLMFSATWPESVQALGARILAPEYSFIQIGEQTQTISQSLVVVDAHNKLARLLGVLAKHRNAIIFVRTRVDADMLTQQLLANNKKAAALHGQLSQDARNAAVASLQSGKIAFLVATDVASRGVDIPGVSLVVNYDMPASIETYVHRIGRTGRAGDKGTAVTFVGENEELLPELRRLRA